MKAVRPSAEELFSLLEVDTYSVSLLHANFQLLDHRDACM